MKRMESALEPEVVTPARRRVPQRLITLSHPSGKHRLRPHGWLVGVAAQGSSSHPNRVVVCIVPHCVGLQGKNKEGGEFDYMKSMGLSEGNDAQVPQDMMGAEGEFDKAKKKVQ